VRTLLPFTFDARIEHPLKAIADGVNCMRHRLDGDQR
jgi:hypothetical protein